MEPRGSFSRVSPLVGAGCLGADPLSWILASDEPYAVWTALGNLHAGATRTDIETARTAVLLDSRVSALVDELPADTAAFSGAISVPGRLNLLADLGVGTGDFARVDALLETMLSRFDREGRLEVKRPDHAGDQHTSRSCDANSVADVSLRYGLGADERVSRAVAQVVGGIGEGPQGSGWQCGAAGGESAHGGSDSRDLCPQATIEGLRALSQLSRDRLPVWSHEVLRSPLEVWRRREDERPHQFGHGYQFKSVKWPNLRYDVLWVLETLSRFPDLWRGPGARHDDRQALCEMAACLIAYNFDERGRVVPRRTHRGFERFSFGVKSAPSPFATARACVVLVRLADLAEDIARVDVTGLPSSKGGGSRATPPLPNVLACPFPRHAVYTKERALARVLARHHIGTSWEPRSIGSVTADVVALHASELASPYLSLSARIPDVSAESVDSALWDIRSLVIHRAMRGRLYAMRRDILPVAHAATKRQVIRYAHEFAEARGIDVRTYEVAADEIADVLAAAGPLSLRGIRARVGVRSDLGAVVGLMCAEGRILRSSPEDGRFGRRWRFDLAERVVPGLHLGGMDERLAARTLLVAYVRAFGPVTLRDAAWWTGRAPLHVKRSIALLEDEIVPVMLDDDQEEYYMHGADVEELERAAILDRPSVALLPSMDPLLTGYADRSRFVDDELRTRVFDRSADVAPVVVVNGRVAGVWDTLAGDRPVVAVHWFSEPDDSTRAAFVSAAERQGRILFGESPLIVRVRRMPPVFGRAGSAAAHPLRGIAEGTEEVPTA